MAISWLLQSLCGCYSVYVAVAGSKSRFSSENHLAYNSYGTALREGVTDCHKANVYFTLPSLQSISFWLDTEIMTRFEAEVELESSTLCYIISDVGI